MRDLIRQILIEERKPKGYWDNEINIETAAKDCETRTEFQNRYQTAYKKALEINKTNLGFFERITKHMPKPKSMFPYTEEELSDIASSAHTKTEFRTKFKAASQVAQKIDKINPGFYDRITSHMVPLGSKHKRMVYGYFFPKNNAVYVGLTYNIVKRNKQHLVTDIDEKKQTTVAKFINETKEPPELVQFTDYIDVKEAQNKESEYVDKFKNSGYLVLNKVKTGGLGHGLKYTDEELRNLLSLISNYKDLYTKHYPLYKATKNRGIDFLRDVTKHMERKQISWSEDLVRQYVKDFNNKSNFQTAFPGAVYFAKTHNFWNSLFPKDPIPSVEEITKIAQEYNTQNDFRIEHPHLYHIADKVLKILPNIIFKNSKKRSKTLTVDDVLNRSKKYTYWSDFYKKDNTAYRKAMSLRKTLGDDFWNELTSKLIGSPK
jgi:hypothetical protein